MALLVVFYEERVGKGLLKRTFFHLTPIVRQEVYKIIILTFSAASSMDFRISLQRLFGLCGQL